MLGDGAQPVDDSPHRQVRREPQHVYVPATEHDRGSERDQLHGEDRAHSAARARVGAEQTGEQGAEQLETGLAGGVADQLAPERVALDRVIAIERHVRFVRAELLTMVGHVAAPVGIRPGEGDVAEQPATGPVVGGAVTEQQAMSGLVHQRRELGVSAAEQHEHRQPGERMTDPCRGDDEADGLDPQPGDAERVAKRGDVAELLAQLRIGAAVGPDQPAGAHRREECPVGHHRARHA